MNADKAISQLVADGAALLMRTDSTPIEVTWWRRVNPGRHFYFTTGEDTFAGHRIDFEREEVLYGGKGVVFYAKDGALVAYLAPLVEQNDDPAWVKNASAVIAAWKTRFERDQTFRAFVLGEYQDAGAGK